MDVYSRLVYLRENRFMGSLAYKLLKLLGAEIPRPVKVGRHFLLVHGGGVVIHSRTVIEDDVRVYQGITLGRADMHVPGRSSRFQGILVRSGAIIGAGAKILCKEGILTVGRDSVIGANAVLLSSTGDGEIWAGVPARLIGHVAPELCRHCDHVSLGGM